MTLQEIIEEFKKDLSGAADAFLKAGLQLFHTRASQAQGQVALVNMSIGCELLVKAFLSRFNIALIISDLSPEDTITFLAPDKIPHSKRSNSTIKLKFRDFKSKEFADCLSMLYALRPEIKEIYGSSLRRIVKARNSGVHSTIASHNIHDVDRAAHVVLKLQECIGKEAESYFVPSKDDNRFLEQFNATRAENVKKVLEAARQNFQLSTFKEIDIVSGGWEEENEACPICGCDGILSGTTEYEVEMSAPDDIDEYLTFYASSFFCDACKLDLQDEEEMRLAGLETVYDRSEDLAKWHFENIPEDGYY